MTTKSEAELEQVALAMMMMAGGEGTLGVAEEVGVKTRSASNRSSVQTRRRSLRLEPVSENCLNQNKNGGDQDDARRSPTEEEEGELRDYKAGSGARGAPDPSRIVDEELVALATGTNDLQQDSEDVPDETIICAINPMSIQSSPSPGPLSPTSSQKSTNSGSGGAGGTVGNGTNGTGSDCVYMSSSRRIFRPEFKQKVLDAFSNDPDCVGNQRATARKFGIHRRQVQKWLQQLSTGELSFKELEQPSAQQDNEDLTDLTSNIKLGHSSQSSTTSAAANRIGKARRSLGNVSRTVVIGNQQIVRNQGVNGRASDPSNRATRSSVRSRGKSMPLKGGSKSAAQFVPTLVHSSSPLPKSALNLTKAATKQNGGAASNSATYAYHNLNDINGDGGSSNTNGGSSMFMNMSTLLASAAAAGNLGMPLSLDQPRNISPREHSPLNNNGRGSPAHSAGGSSGSGGSTNSSLQNALLLVDELNYLYPYSDFSLLRKALLKEEVSLEKLAHPLIRNRSEFRVNGTGLNSDGGHSGRRSEAHSPPNRCSQKDYKSKQTLAAYVQQQEYLKLLQQCGIGNSSEINSGLNLAELINNGKLPTWFNPFAAAATAGFPIPSTSGGKHTVNGHGNDNGNGNGRQKEAAPDNHRFASPRVPPVVNSGKAKTVAAALAATRVQSQPQQNRQGNGGRNFSNEQNGRQNQNSRVAQRRKPNLRQTATITSQMEDDIDPTSMLEVVTSIPSPTLSPRNQYGYNGNNQQSNVQRNNGNANANYHQGMDLTTTASSLHNSTTTTTTAPRLVSKAMNKEYSFLNELGLVRKVPEENPKVSNGFGMTHTASLENFVQNILPPRQKSPQASSSTSSSSPPAGDLNDMEKTKTMVIDAFTYDPNISGDARAVARKFGLSVRVVQKWLKEVPVKCPSLNNDSYHVNGLRHSNDNNNFHGSLDEDEEHNGYLQTQNLHKAMLNESNNNSGGVNKRKNSKPNQICDFTMEDEAGLNGALDMVVPIKKRRVSSPGSAPQDV